MDDVINILIGILSGAVLTLFMMPYTLNESVRDSVNRCIMTIGEEISWNLNTVILYKKHIDELQKSWINNKEIGNFRTWYYSITVGNNGPIFTTLKFDAFNFYKNSDVPSIVGIASDYVLTEFYSECKRFCFNLECIQNRMVEHNAKGNYDLVENEWENLNIEFYNFSNAFRKYACCLSPEIKNIKYMGIKKANFIEWYFYRNRDMKIFFIDKVDY